MMQLEEVMVLDHVIFIMTTIVIVVTKDSITEEFRGTRNSVIFLFFNNYWYVMECVCVCLCVCLCV